MMKIRIGILEVGRPPQELANLYPDYAQMTADWLGPIDGDVTVYPVMDGATIPAPELADLWVITGSKCAVYEKHAWIPGLIQFVQVAKKLPNVKMLGICFGHQLIAKALGGRVEKSDKGWGLGVQRYTTALWPTVFGSCPSEFAICAYHQDQVVEPPQSARLIVTSAFCEFAGLWYPGFAMTFQAHPEFDLDYLRDLLVLRHSAGALTDELAHPAIASTQGECNRFALRDLFVKYWSKL